MLLSPTWFHHTFFEPRSEPLRTLKEILSSNNPWNFRTILQVTPPPSNPGMPSVLSKKNACPQLSLGILGKFHKPQLQILLYPTTFNSPTSSRIWSPLLPITSLKIFQVLHFFRHNWNFNPQGLHSYTTLVYLHLKPRLLHQSLKPVFPLYFPPCNLQNCQ